MKKLIFVSTGRCGTKRIYELLNQYLTTNVSIVHQIRFSRLANVLGTIMIQAGGNVDFSFMYEAMTRRYYQNSDTFISTDPLTAMIIPTQITTSSDTCIVHLVRKDLDFANSMYMLSRSRFPSFVAHNFIPFWQPCVLPCENILNTNIRNKYAQACNIKNRYLEERYRVNPFYMKIDHKDIFTTSCLEEIIFDFLGIKISIPKSALARRSNESQRSKSD